MNGKTIVKHIARFITSITVGLVITNAIKATTPDETTGIEKAGVVVGGAILSSMISDAAVEYVANEIEHFTIKPEDKPKIDSE